VTDPDHDAPDPESLANQPETDSAPPGSTSAQAVDLDAVERDLTGVEVALSRLAEGTYWTDEVTGSPIPDHILAADPTARRS
jgi:RNA polymerase-binding transcription factor DksA